MGKKTATNIFSLSNRGSHHTGQKQSALIDKKGARELGDAAKPRTAPHNSGYKRTQYKLKTAHKTYLSQ